MLQFYYGKECDHCERMKPLVAQLEKEFSVTFERYEIWHDENNRGKFDSYAKDVCPGVPFLYNTETKKFICGESSYEELKILVQ